MKIENKISFILPVYKTNINQVSECLDSILSQNKKFIEEIILVDDASGEDYKFQLKNLISSRSRKDCKIILVESASNKGPANSRKLGYESSSGQIIVFIDSDDILIDKNFAEQICSKFNMKNDLQLIRFKWMKFKNLQHLNKVWKKRIKNVEDISYEFTYNIEFLTKIEWWMAVWQFAIKRSVFEQYSELLDNNLNEPFEDVYFSFILAANELKALQINKIYYGYRFPNKNSFLWRVSEEKKKSIIYILEVLNLWLTSFNKYNLNNPKLKDMWVMWCIPYVVVFGYNKMRKKIKDFPSKVEIRDFIEKYKFRKNRKLFLFLLNLNLNSKFFDFLIPLPVNIALFIKKKILRYKPI